MYFTSRVAIEFVSFFLETKFCMRANSMATLHSEILGKICMPILGTESFRDLNVLFALRLHNIYGLTLRKVNFTLYRRVCMILVHAL